MQANLIHTLLWIVVSRFMRRHAKAVALGVESICGGEDFPKIRTARGRVWMKNKKPVLPEPVGTPAEQEARFWAEGVYVVFDMEVYVPLRAEDAVAVAGIDTTQFVDVINHHLAKKIECFVKEVTLRYDEGKQRYVVASQIYWDFPYDG